ncbi:MAG: restriction endonuclease subunit S [bacterium]
MQTLKLTKKYDKYPEYKDSGVEWLGKIPKGWESQKVVSVFDFPHDKVTEENYEPLSVTYGGIKKQIENAAKVAEGSLRKHVKIGDIAINGRSDRKGAVGMSEYEGGVSLVYNVLRKRNPTFDSKYFHYLFRSNLFSEEFYRWGRGIVDDLWTTRESEMKRILITVPESKEQTKIANYLDEKTSFIDQIIEKKEIQIELLKERRTALVNHMIMDIKGDFVKIKNHVQVNPTKKVVSDTDLEDTVSFVPMEAISENGKLELQEKKYKEVKDGFTYFRNGDVVLAKITPCYENGKAGVMKGLKNGFGFGTTEFMVMRPKDSILADYLYYLIFSDKFRKSGEVEMRGTAGQKRVTTSFVRNYEFSLPNLEKQKEIVNKLNEKTKLFDTAIRKTEQSIEILKEFKSSLISNVVTGKVKI